VLVSDSEPIPLGGQDWLDVATERLSTELVSSLRVSRARPGFLLDLLAALAKRERGSAEPVDPQLRSLLDLAGIVAEDDSDLTHEIADIVERGEAIGFASDALPQVSQAYVRAVGRIAAVEAGVTVQALRSISAEERPQMIDGIISLLVPVSLRAFDILHRSLLQDALVEAAASGDADNHEVAPLAIGMVDLVGSSAHLATATVGDLEQMVDTIFAAGQAATTERAAHVVKYVGDGLFIASHDVANVADAALEIVEQLEQDLPLRARGGVSYGPVVQRAGDVFGMPVNLAQALCKAARPGTVLLSRDAADIVDPAKRGRLHTRRLPNPAFGRQTVATLQLISGAQ